VYESIAKEDTRRGLLANEKPRETLIKTEQLGSALPDDVVSPIIRHVKSPNLQDYARSFYAHGTARGPRRARFWLVGVEAPSVYGSIPTPQANATA